MDYASMRAQRASLTPSRSALALLALLAAATASAAGDLCEAGETHSATVPVLCAPVHGADPGLAGEGVVTAYGGGGAELGALSLLPREPDGLLLAGELPDLAASDALTLATDATLWPCPAEADDPAARFAPVSLAAEGGRVALLLAAAPPTILPLPGAVTILHAYADADVRVRAECDLEPETDLVTALLVDFTLEPGWNLIVNEVHETNGSLHMELRDATEEDLERVEWYALDYADAAPRPAE